MKEHGEVSVAVEGNVVRSRPRLGSNTEAINRNWGQILETASGLDGWILWADVDPTFALTPESLETVISWISRLEELGCIGMAATISNPLIGYYAEKVKARIPVPFLATESVEEIKTFIQDLTKGN